MTELPKGSKKLEHGTKCFCGTCGSKGTWDDMNHSDEPDKAEFQEDAVWYNKHEGHIECHECWLK